jgi:hypothetical protein
MVEGNLEWVTMQAQMLTGNTTSAQKGSRSFHRTGVYFGGGPIILRPHSAISLAAAKSWDGLKKMFPSLIPCGACIAIAQGQWAQPSALGYSISWQV